MKKELRQLSKSELIRQYLALEQRVAELERLLKAFDNPHTPPSKKRKNNTKKDDDNPRFPGKPKGSNGGGVNIPPPDDVIEHTLEACPVSGAPLGAPIGYRKKIIIDFPDKPLAVTEHRIMQYVSPATGNIIEPVVSLPKGIYGKNIKSITVLLKNLTNSHAKIASFFRELGAPSFSTAEVQRIADEAANQLEPAMNEQLNMIRKAPYVHSDETGMRRDGQSGYIWGLFTKTTGLFSARMSRARTVIQTLLEEFKGVIVTDGYRAYDSFPLRQRCWTHLLRECKEYADDPEIAVQYCRLKVLYEHLKLLNEKPPDPDEIDKAKWNLNDIITCLKVIKGARKLATYIKNGGDDWFTALHHEGVPLQNNLAERGLRPLVVLRKMIGCYRNEKGQRWIDIVISVLYTWQLQNKNLYQNLRTLNW